jgi:hypothetical protein
MMVGSDIESEENQYVTYWFSSDSISLPTIMLHTGSPQTLYQYQPSCYILVLLRLYHYQPSCYILVLLRLYITTNYHATYWFSSDSIGSDIESKENQYVA